MIPGNPLKILIKQFFIHIETVSNPNREVTVFAFQYFPGFCFTPAGVFTNLF